MRLFDWREYWTGPGVTTDMQQDLLHPGAIIFANNQRWGNRGRLYSKGRGRNSLVAEKFHDNNHGSMMYFKWIATFLQLNTTEPV